MNNGPPAVHIAKSVNREIERGALQRGELLPRAEGVARQYHVTPAVGRHALKLLVLWGAAEIVRTKKQKTRHRVRSWASAAQVRKGDKRRVDRAARRRATVAIAWGLPDRRSLGTTHPVQ